MAPLARDTPEGSEEQLCPVAAACPGSLALRRCCNGLALGGIPAVGREVWLGVQGQARSGRGRTLDPTCSEAHSPSSPGQLPGQVMGLGRQVWEAEARSG